jgi:glucokinase
MARYAGVDLGATNVRAVVADGTGDPVGRDRQATPRGPNGIAVTEAVLSVLRGACEDAEVTPESLTAAGIGSIGPLDLAEGAVTDPANLPDPIEHVPLVGPIRELIDSERVHLHNDTAAGVIGQRFYSDLSPDDMVYVTISTGIGAGVAVDGNVLSGWDGNAGEVGHVTVDPDGLMPCGCGGDGHWEAYCSGDNLPAYAAEVHEREEVPTDLPVEDPDFSAADLFDAVGEDPLADELAERVADWNAIGMATIVSAYAPIVVYLGGAVALNNPEVVVDPIRERIDDLVMSNVPEIRLTSLGEDVVVLGAAASAMTGGTGDRSRT